MRLIRLDTGPEWIDTVLGEVRLAVRLAAGRSAGDGGKPVALCLAGGTTPPPIYRALAADVEFESSCAKAGLDLWPGDERVVPAGDPARNGRMIAESFSAALPGGLWKCPARLRVWPEGDAAASCAAFEAELDAALGRPPRFDLVILGLGADGHTAGLFPGDAALDVSDRMTAVSFAPSEPRARITLTFPALAAARRTLILARGPDKAAIVERVMSGDRTAPAARIPGEDCILIYTPEK